MSLPALQNWEATRQALHSAAQVIGGIKKVSIQPLPNYAHLGLFIVNDGLTSGHLADGGELRLNFAQANISYTCPAGTISTVSLKGYTQASLTDAVLKSMADAGHPASNVDTAHIADQTPLEVNASLAAEYQQALFSVYSAIARFRAQLFGYMSPVVVFPHGFDASFLWFKRGSEERSDPHLNFGFSPGSPGFLRPYIYSYASPIPATYFDAKLPEIARFVRDPWKGIVVDYDKLAAESDPESALEQTLVEIQSATGALLV